MSKWREEFSKLDQEAELGDIDDMAVLEARFNNSSNNSGQQSGLYQELKKELNEDFDDLSNLESQFEKAQSPENKIINNVKAGDRNKAVDDFIAAVTKNYPTPKKANVTDMYNDDEYLRLRTDVRY